MSAGSQAWIGQTSKVASAAADAVWSMASTVRRRRGDMLTRLLGHAFWDMPITGWHTIDVVALMAGIHLGFTLFVDPQPIPYPHVEYWQALVIYGGALLASALVFGLAEREALLSRSTVLTRLLLTCAAATVVAYAVIYILMYTTISRRVAGCAIGFYLGTAIPLRLAAHWAIHKVKRNVLFVGNENLWKSFSDARAEGHFSRYSLLGFVRASQQEGAAVSHPKCLGSTDDIPALCQRLDVSDIVVGAESSDEAQTPQWLLTGLYHGCRVTNECTFFEKATGCILLERMTTNWFLLADLKAHCQEYAALKRSVDILTAAVGLVLSAPLWIIIGLAIKLFDRGPVFYSQDRVSQYGRVFRLYKFRTMRVGAEPNGPVWTSPNDPRVTRLGRVLRRTRLDELPQLFNILIGDMSIVGPRPERPDFVLSLSREVPFYNERHLVKPGLTGWAQIGFRYGNSVEDARRKLQFDLYYLKHMSLELDFVILFRTLGTLIRGSM